MSGAEADGYALMTQGAEVLIDGVVRLGAAWVVRSVTALDTSPDRTPAPRAEMLVRRKLVPGWAVQLQQ